MHDPRPRLGSAVLSRRENARCTGTTASARAYSAVQQDVSILIYSMTSSARASKGGKVSPNALQFLRCRVGEDVDPHPQGRRFQVRVPVKFFVRRQLPSVVRWPCNRKFSDRATANQYPVPHIAAFRIKCSALRRGSVADRAPTFQGPLWSLLPHHPPGGGLRP